MNRIWKILLLLIFFFFYYVIIIKGTYISCLFKDIIGIKCPMCGISRAIVNLLSGNILLAHQYNLLIIPVFIFLFINAILLIIDIILNKELINKLYKKLGNYYILIIIIFVLNMIVNNIRSI